MTFKVVKNIFYFLICVASVGSNSLLISILLRFEHLRTTTNLFVLNLAFCDIATVLLSIPFTVATEESTSYPFGELGCMVLMPSATAAFNSAAFTLLAIAIDRFYAIMFPMRARLQSCKMKSLAVCLLHGVSVMSVIPFAVHQRLVKAGNSYHCKEIWPNDESRIYTLALFSIQYMIPLTVIAVLYSISWNQIRKKNKVIIKMQELQQKGTRHFSRSQSWDVAMKKSDSFGFLLGEAPPKVAGTEKQVAQSTSSYSFMSSQLEAVAETNGNESSQKTEGVSFDGRIDPDVADIEKPEDEQIIMINMHKRSQLDSGQQVVKNGGNNIESKEHAKNGAVEHSNRDTLKTLIDEKDKYKKRRPRDYEDKTLHAKQKSSNSSRFKLKSPLPFTSRFPWLKSDCLPKQVQRSKRKSIDNLDRQTQSFSDGHEFDLTHTATGQENWRGDSLKEGRNTSETPESIGAVDFKTPLEDTETTALVQGRITGPGNATKRGDFRTETAPSTVNKSFDKHANAMFHSMSSPALGTTSHGNPRRQSSQTSLTKGASNMEARLARISQIAMQAKQKVSQALTTSSSENMCSASIKRMKQTRRTLRMFTCVVVVFAVCMLPNQVTWIWMAFNGFHLNHVLYTVFYFLTYTNSVINPWIYGAVNPSFRKAYRKMFCCRPSATSTRHSPMRRSSSKLTYLCTNRGEIEVNSSKPDARQKESSLNCTDEQK